MNNVAKSMEAVEIERHERFRLERNLGKGDERAKSVVIASPNLISQYLFVYFFVFFL